MRARSQCVCCYDSGFQCLSFHRQNLAGGHDMLTRYPIFLFLFALALMFMNPPAESKDTGAALPDLAQLEKMSSRFAPTPLRVDTSKLTPSDRQALVKLIEAARLLDDIYMRQLWNGNAALYARL